MKVGEQFQEQTKYHRDSLSGLEIDREKKPDPYKVYPVLLERIELEPVDEKGEEQLYQIIKERRSVRRYQDKPLDLSTLSQLLWSSQGITSETEYYQLRATPSAGALYPIETYLLVNKVEGINPGFYHYQVPFHNLVLIRKGNFGKHLRQASLEQKLVEDAPVVFLWTAIIGRARWKYGQRAYRYIYVDVGHIAQNLALAAVSCGLGSCAIGAFFDDEINRLLEVDGKEETILYLTALGYST